MIVVTVAVICVTFVILYLLKISYTRSRYRHFRSPPFRRLDWIPGHVLEIKRARANATKEGRSIVFSDILQRFFTMVKTKTMVLFFFDRAIIFSRDVDIAATVLSNHEKFKKSKFMNDNFSKLAGVRFFGRQGLLTNPGDEIWYQKRKVMDNAFHKRSLKSTFGMMNNSADRLVDLIKDTNREGTVMDLFDVLGTAALDVIINIGFSIDKNVLTPEKPRLLQSINDVVNGMGTLFRNQQTFNLPCYFRELKANLSQQLIFARSFLKSSLEKRMASKEDMEEKNDILAHIIRANMSLPNIGMEEIIDDFFVFLAAGMETTANTMSFFLLNMIKHQEAYERAKNEVDTVYGEGTEISFEDLNKLVYLEQCIKESLRIYAVAEATGRVTLQDVTINGMYIPKGTVISINQSLMQRDPDYWGENATSFDPDNFAPGKVIKPFTYMPFMVGPRSCIGKHFAMLEMKVMLSKLLLHFEFSDPYPEKQGRIKTRSDITQKPLDGVPILIATR